LSDTTPLSVLTKSPQEKAVPSAFSPCSTHSSTPGQKHDADILGHLKTLLYKIKVNVAGMNKSDRSLRKREMGKGKRSYHKVNVLKQDGKRDANLERAMTTAEANIEALSPDDEGGLFS
jgi:hypothetical protein